MLVLSRRTNESVIIGQDVVVTVLEVRGDLVRIGIHAPKHIQVHRQEVFEALREANQEAASPSTADVRTFASGLLGRRTDPDGDGAASSR